MAEEFWNPSGNAADLFNTRGWNPRLVYNAALSALADYDVWDDVVSAPMTALDWAMTANGAAEGIQSPYSPQYSWPMVDRGQAYLQRFCSQADIPTWYDPNYVVGLYKDEYFAQPPTMPSGTLFYVRFPKKPGIPQIRSAQQWRVL